MLKKVSIIVCAFLLTSFVFAQTAGDFVYELDKGRLWITEYTGTASKVTVPAKLNGISVFGIDGEAFCENETLTSVVLSEGIQVIGDGYYYEYDDDEDYDLWGAFDSCTKLSSVKLPASLEYIGDGAFQYCESLTGITIPKRVTAIGDHAFDRSGLKKFVYNGNIKKIGIATFVGCESLTSVDLKGVESIGGVAFFGCTALKTITLPATITEIGTMAFANCPSLTTIKIPSSVKTLNIGQLAFLGCPLNAASIELLKKYGYTP